MSIQNIEEQILKSIQERIKMSKVIYKGEPTNDKGMGDQPVHVLRGEKIDPLEDLVEEGAKGFNWGYGGTGPANLALCIVKDFFGKEAPQVQFYHDLKWNVIAGLKQGQSFQITSEDLNKWWEDFLQRNRDVEKRLKEAAGKGQLTD
jgi:hypothetical protein